MDSSPAKQLDSYSSNLSKEPQTSSLTDFLPEDEASKILHHNANELSHDTSKLDLPEKVQPTPIFAWRAETTDGIHISASEIHDRVPDQYADVDSTIRAILEERDNEAGWSLGHESELAAIRDILDSSRMQLLMRMERIGIELIQFEDSDQLARKRAKWALKKEVISNAMAILNAFVPLYYQDIHRYWVIKKFYGAAMRIANEEVRPDDLDIPTTLTRGSSPTHILRMSSERCHIFNRSWSKSRLVSHMVPLANLPTTSFPKRWLVHSVG